MKRWLRVVTRRVDRGIEEVAVPRLDQLSGQIDEVRQAVVELRRLAIDDMDASNEVAAHLGRSLAALTAAVGELRAEVASLRDEGRGARSRP